MFGLHDLQITWWVIIGFMMILYACTGGFDYGATMIMPFMRQENERRVVLNVVGRTWDGNQTWLVFIGGAIFVIWPAVYATIFSGFYAAMLIILWSLFLRPPGFDFRSKINSPVWRRAWDWGLFLSSVLPMFAFGLALGNIMEGVPIHFDAFTLRPFYDGDFWGLLNGFGILCGLTSVAMGLMHASALLFRRTTGDMKKFFRRLFFLFGFLFFCLFVGAGFMAAFSVTGYDLVTASAHPFMHPLMNVVTTHAGGWVLSYAQYPWKAYPPVLVYVGLALAFILMAYKNGDMAFWASCLTVGATVATFGAAMFPFVVPSSIAPDQSLTLWTAATGYYKLNIMLYIAVVLLIFIFIYKMFAYRAVWADKNTMSVDDLKQNEHEFY